MEPDTADAATICSPASTECADDVPTIVSTIAPGVCSSSKGLYEHTACCRIFRSIAYGFQDGTLPSV